ncbi:SRPBCC family protein [Cellulomonas persica]|uniref:Polyketide cyclase n=1 Tax=Cellulomonas persica TaxID=76861 RepID=A0A510UP71_9CELL|nr:SRPBCC family protein [Cellulomonas persica]GEK16457.1 polyketide cyclase [Cellulomonas persica]
MATVARRMRCEPKDVLDVLADGWSYAAWVVGTARIRQVDDAWPAPGSRIAHSAGLWPALINDTTSVVAWDPEGRLELRARGWPAGEAHIVLEVVPQAGGGTLVRMEEDAVRGAATLLPRPLRDAALVPRNAETLRRLAYIAEDRSTR